MLSDEIPEVSSVEIDVPGLGKIKGLSYDGQTSGYYGIQYATIPGRFRRSVPAPAPWKDNFHDGTKLGPYCPQPPRDFYPIPAASRPWLDMPSTSEFDCLNLNITVPHLPSQGSREKLPVMVFLHGGAFCYASGSAPIYDGRILSTTSSTVLSRPTIIITLNYRLGVYGFLGGRDIEEYAKDMGEEGSGNWGIWDQVMALRWIQKHISGFGGDPRRVTLFGQSAGGVSIAAHLLRNEPLFSSAIVQSGLLRLTGVMSIDEYQICYEQMLKALSIPLELSPKERMTRFLEVDEETMTLAMVPAFIIPVVTFGLCDDGVLIPGSMPKYSDYEIFDIPSWCPNIMMGDCINECIIWNKAWDAIADIPRAPTDPLAFPTAKRLIAKMEDFLGKKKAKIICDLYGINPDLSDKDTFDKLERFTSHGMYNIPHYFAEKASPSVYAWHFDVPSPYDNAWGGMAHHSFDNVLVWGVLKHTVPETHQRIGEVMVEAWVKFANGEEPWERFGVKNRWMVFEKDGAKLKTREEDAGRGYEIWDKLHEAGLVAEFAELSDELCIRRRELLDRERKVEFVVEGENSDVVQNKQKEIGIL